MFALRIALGVAALAIVVACAPAIREASVLPSLYAEDGGVDPEGISHIEAQVELPEGAEPLEAYDRYYAVDRVGAQNAIHGVYLLRRSFGGVDRGGMMPVAGNPGAFRGDAVDLPMIADGGCSVITVLFDVEMYEFFLLQVEGSDRALSPALCNGLA